jgi:hypothetical protein
MAVATGIASMTKDEQSAREEFANLVDAAMAARGMERAEIEYDHRQDAVVLGYRTVGNADSGISYVTASGREIRKTLPAIPPPTMAELVNARIRSAHVISQ